MTVSWDNTFIVYYTIDICSLCTDTGTTDTVLSSPCEEQTVATLKIKSNKFVLQTPTFPIKHFVIIYKNVLFSLLYDQGLANSLHTLQFVYKR